MALDFPILVVSMGYPLYCDLCYFALSHVTTICRIYIENAVFNFCESDNKAVNGWFLVDKICMVVEVRSKSSALLQGYFEIIFEKKY